MSRQQILNLSVLPLGQRHDNDFFWTGAPKSVVSFAPPPPLCLVFLSMCLKVTDQLRNKCFSDNIAMNMNINNAVLAT